MSSSLAPMKDCIFGDGLVTSSTLTTFIISLPMPQMKCQSVLDYISSLNQFPGTLCGDPGFRRSCCDTCKSKKKILSFEFHFQIRISNLFFNYKEYAVFTCLDGDVNCPLLVDYCQTDLQINTKPISEVCKLSCGACASK